jgi:hypothetical protein
MSTKSIYDYFNDWENYPKVCNGEILPFNTIYQEVSTTFLDAFINSCEKHLICYTLDYFSEDLEAKKAYIENINTNGYSGAHTKFSEIEDDIFIIARIEDGYMLFWYHLSGRCSIGRFKTDDSIDDIEKALLNWIEGMKQDYLITGASRLDTNKYLSGWLHF